MINASDNSALHFIDAGTFYGGHYLLSIGLIPFQVMLFIVGLFIHVNIIYVSNRERETSWLLSITNSVVLIFHFGHCILYQNLTYFVPFFPGYTGSWVCYLDDLLFSYCLQSCVMYSLVVSILKYIFVVHYLKVHNFGKAKIQKFILCVNLVLPLLLTISTMLTQGGGILETQFQKCIINSKDTTETVKPPNIPHEDGLFCPKIKTEDYSFTVFYLAKTFCILQKVLVAAIASNLPEAVFYCRIFHKMKRYER